MRNALIVLVVVALVLVVLGAVNNGLLFDIDFVAGTWTAVSLFWVAVVVAGIVVLTGVVAAFFARSGAVVAQRKLETELQGTYERLRAAGAKVPRPAVDQASVVDVSPGEQTAVTRVAAAPAPDEPRPEADAPPDTGTMVTAAAPEAETAVTGVTRETETAVIATATEAPPASPADESPPAADVTDEPPSAAS